MGYEMARKRKSSLYKTRISLKLNVDFCAQLCGVDRETYQEWEEQGNEIAAKYLRLWDCKHVGVDGWNGWCFSRGVLKHGRQQWTPKTILNDRKFRETLELDTLQLMKGVCPI